MSRNTREQTVRKARAERMSLQFDQALSEAAGSLEALGTRRDNSGDGSGDPGAGVSDAGGEVSGKAGGDDRGREAADHARAELLPLELQLSDFERAVNTILEQRDQILYGYGEADGEEAGKVGADPGRDSVSPSPQPVNKP